MVKRERRWPLHRVSDQQILLEVGNKNPWMNSLIIIQCSGTKTGVGSVKVAPHSVGADPVNNRCTVTVTLPLLSPKLLMLEIAERVAASTMVRSTANIDKVKILLVAYSLHFLCYILLDMITECVYSFFQWHTFSWHAHTFSGVCH